MYFQASKYSPRHNLFEIGLVFCVGAHNINKLEFLRESLSQNLFFILFILEDPFEVLQSSFVVPLMGYIAYFLSVTSDGSFTMGEKCKRRYEDNCEHERICYERGFGTSCL